MKIKFPTHKTDGKMNIFGRFYLDFKGEYNKVVINALNKITF